MSRCLLASFFGVLIALLESENSNGDATIAFYQSIGILCFLLAKFCIFAREQNFVLSRCLRHLLIELLAYSFLIWIFGVSLRYQFLDLALLSSFCAVLNVEAEICSIRLVFRFLQLWLSGSTLAFPKKCALTSSWEPEIQLKASLGCVLFSWCSAYFYPLDWIIPWIRFPIPTYIGATLGYILFGFSFSMLYSMSSKVEAS